MSGSKSKSNQDSTSTSRSRTFEFKFSDMEELLQGLNLETLMTQIGAIEQQVAFQNKALGVAGPALDDLNRDQQIQANLLSPEQRSAQLQAQNDRNQQFGAAQDELLQRQLEFIRGGQAATETQRDLINTATEAQILRGEQDIKDFGREAVNLITQELAPSRGLRPSDTPIQDRAFSVGAEQARQQGRLVSDLRGQQAQAELNFPLAANQSVQFQQQLGQNALNFQQQLEQQSYQNRLNLFGQTGQLGLGLIGASQPDANLQQAFKPQLGTSSSGTQTGTGNTTTVSGGISARALKHDMREIDADEILEALLTLPVEKWKYLYPAKDGHGDHIGPYAEDFQQAFGVGDGKTLSYINAIGVLMASVQALARRVRELGKESPE